MAIIDHERRTDRWEWTLLCTGFNRLHSLFHCTNNGNTSSQVRNQGSTADLQKARVLSNSSSSAPAFSWACVFPLLILSEEVCFKEKKTQKEINRYAKVLHSTPDAINTEGLCAGPIWRWVRCSHPREVHSLKLALTMIKVGQNSLRGIWKFLKRCSGGSKEKDFATSLG